MTELDYIEIEGFKGIEHVEFEPSSINVITGRNNTGKTSFLEAVDLLFTPENVQRFSENIDTVVNVNHDSSEIRGHDGGTAVELRLRSPSRGEVRNVAFEAVSSAMGIETPVTGLKRWSHDIEELTDEVKTIARQVVSEELTEEDVTGLRNEMLNVSVDGERHRYVAPGTAARGIVRRISERAADELAEDDEVAERYGQGQQPLDDFASGKALAGPRIRFSRGGTFLTQPDSAGVTKFVESTDLTGSIEGTDSETDAVKIDDIGDYVKDAGLVDDLKTFTLDYLVFESDDGEKYQIPYDFMGDGFKSIVGLLWELLDDDAGNDIVLIEEPENHMHPGYVLELVHFLIDLSMDEDIQFFITTHDNDFIKDFFGEMPDEKRAYLEDEFSLVKMNDFGADVLDYPTAERKLKELHTDLRGI